MPLPSKTAIDALKRRPELADQFDQKFGKGASKKHLRETAPLEDLLRQLIDRIDRLIDLQLAPRRVIRDENDDIIGSEIADEEDFN